MEVLELVATLMIKYNKLADLLQSFKTSAGKCQPTVMTSNRAVQVEAGGQKQRQHLTLGLALLCLKALEVVMLAITLQALTAAVVSEEVN